MSSVAVLAIALDNYNAQLCSSSTNAEFPDHWRTRDIVTSERSKSCLRPVLAVQIILGKVGFSIIPICTGVTNYLIDVVFDDVNEAELQLDSIADGQLYRDRRANEITLIGRDKSYLGGHSGGRASFSQVAGRGGHQARGNGGSNREGGSSSPGKHAPIKGSSGTPPTQKR